MNKKRGETILEVLIAMTVLVLVLTSTFNLLLQAMKTNTAIKNRVVALNIAREGIEGVRNIRDTNWLRYSGNRREKWMCRDYYAQNDANQTPYDFTTPISNNVLHVSDTTSIGGQVNAIRGCSHVSTTPVAPSHDETITSGGYILHYVSMPDPITTKYIPAEIFNQYVLEPKYTYDIITDSGNKYWDGTGGSPTAIDQEEFRLYIEENRNGVLDWYTHSVIADDRVNPATENVPSIYYRKIIIDRVSPFEDPNNPGTESGDTLCAGGDPDDSTEGECEDGKVKVTSIVEWQDKEGNWNHVVLEAQLFDFYQRTHY